MLRFLIKSAAHLHGSLCRCLIGMGLTCLAFPAQAADIFVDNTGFGGAYTTIEAAFSAAGANDTIWVRGGQSFSGTDLAWGASKSGISIYGGWNGNQIAPQSNATISANDAFNISNPNAGRLPETTWTGGRFVDIANTAGANVSGVTIRGMTFQNSTANLIEISRSGVTNAVRTDYDFSNNVFSNLNAHGVNFASGGAGGSINGVLLSGNRVTFAAGASARTAFFLGNTGAFPTDVTVLENYVFDNASATGGNRGINADMLVRGVVANNLFDSMSNQSVGNINSTKGFVVADNVFEGNGKTQRAIIASPRTNDNSLPPGSDADIERLLISNNQISGHVGQGIDLTMFTGLLTGDDGYNDVWIRHNLLNADAADYQASTFNAVSALSIRVPGNTQGNGPITVENNDLNITGNRSTLEMQAIRLAGVLPTAGTGGLTIRNNNFNALGSTAGVPYVGIRMDPLDGTFGNMGAVSFNIANNNLNGFPTAVGVYDTLSSSTVGDLAAGSTVNVNDNNFLGSITNDFVHGGVGPNIDGQNNHYADSTANATGNVTTNANVGSPFSVAGRTANYVTFRGDHDLSNAVDAADAAILVTNFGTSGPGASYFDGDSTLDQVVDLDDGKVFARFFNQPIAASGVITNPASAGPPSVFYDPVTGALSFTAGAQGSIWGLRLMDGTTVLLPQSTSPTALNSSWLYANQPQGIEFYDDSFGTLGDFAGNGIFAMLAPGLSGANFGQVEYFFGQGENVSSAFTSVGYLPEPSTFTLLAMSMAAFATRRRRR